MYTAVTADHRNAKLIYLFKAVFSAPAATAANTLPVRHTCRAAARRGKQLCILPALHARLLARTHFALR